MTKHVSTKKALLASILALMLCFSMLVGTTFAWFTDTVTSANNIIASGTLDVEMYYADGTKAVPADDSTDWIDASTGAIFSYDKWEPGYAEVRHIKIANEGTLALKYKVEIVANGTVSDLANVIDVYYVDPAVQVADRDALVDSYKLGTLADVLAGLATTGHGTLIAGDDDTITLALKMQETAGNEYQDKEIGTDFAVQVFATQLNSEKDSFDENYDKPAEYDIVSVPVTRPATGSNEDVVLKAADEKSVAIEVPATVVEALPAEVTSMSVVHTTPKVDTTAATISFDSIEIVDQDGKVIDLEVLGNTTPVTITLPAQTTFAPGTAVDIYHDGVKVTSAVVAADGTITYEVNHLCEVTVTVPKITTLEDFKAAIVEGKETIYLDGRFEIDDWGDVVNGTSIRSGVTIVGGTIVRATGNYEGLKIYTSDLVKFEGVTFETVKGNSVVTPGKGTNIEFNNCAFVGLAAPSTGNTGIKINANDVTLNFNNCTLKNMPVQVNYSYTGITLKFDGCTLDWTGANCPGVINMYNNSVSDIDFVNCTLTYDASATTKAYDFISTKTSVGAGTTIDFDNVKVVGVGAEGKVWRIVGKGGTTTGNNVVVTAKDNVTYTFNGEAVDVATYLFA